MSPKERADFRRGFVGSVNRPRRVIAGLEAAIVDDAAAAGAPRVGRRVCRRWSRYAAISQVDPTAFGPKKEGPRPLYLVPGNPEDVVNRKFVKYGCSIFSQRQDYIRWDLFFILILYNGLVLVLWRSLLTKNDQMAYFFEAISKLNWALTIAFIYVEQESLTATWDGFRGLI